MKYYIYLLILVIISAGCQFDTNPCSISEEVLIEIHKLDSLISIPSIQKRDREWLENNYNEPSLLDAKTETYRFILESSFDGTEIYRMEKIKDKFIVTKKFFQYPEDKLSITRKFQISIDVWNNVVDSLSVCNFWTYIPSIDRTGFDGATWTLEGYNPVKNKCTLMNYQRIERWSPMDTTFIKMGKLFLQLDKN